MPEPAKLMLDSQIFDRLTDGRLNHAAVASRCVLVTHIQRDELERAPPGRRGALLRTFTVVSPEYVPTSTSVWDDTDWDGGEWSQEDARYERMLERLQVLDADAGKRCTPENQSRDIRIGETALRLGCVLVSDDSNLRQVLREFGGRALSSVELTLYSGDAQDV